MKNLFTLLLICVLPTFSIAQSIKPKPNILWVIKANGTGKDIVTRNLIANPSSIEKIVNMPADEIQRRFATLKPNGVWVVTLKPDVNLVKITELYNSRGINQMLRTRPVSLDGAYLSDTSDVYFDSNYIQEVKSNSDSVKIRTISFRRRMQSLGKTIE